jgi:AraC-like DNA-binding protein
VTALDRAAFAGPFRIRDVHYAAGETYARHAHDELQISIILRGAMREETGGVSYDGRTGDIVIKPAKLMHADSFEGGRIICIDVDPSCVDLPFRAYAWHRTNTPIAMRLARHFLAGDVDELLGALPSAITRDRVIATRAARALDETFAGPRDLAALANDLGVHRVYLSRVFRMQWGCSPREYLQDIRARAAAHRLASTARALADIALETGFSDQAHMSRVFLRRVGMTPMAFRRLARA